MAIATPGSILRDEIPTSTKNILGSACEAHRAVGHTALAGVAGALQPRSAIAPVVLASGHASPCFL